MKISISLAVVVILIGFIVNRPVGADLLIHYDFESEDLEDVSGNDNVGEIREDPEHVGGQVGMALKFDGVDDYIFMSGEGNATGPVILTHNTFAEKTVAMWIQADDVDEDHTLFQQGGYAQGYGIRINAGELFLSVVNSNTVASVTADYKDTGWHHIGAVFNQGDLLLYIDGKEAAAGEAGYQQVGAHANEGAIGASYDDDTWGRDTANIPYNFFQGIMDEFYYYDNALTAQEIMALCELGTAVELSGKLITRWAALKQLH